MEIETQAQLIEDMEKKEQEKEDDATAAREAAKDLGIDPEEEENKKNDDDDDQKVVSKAISNTDSLVNVMRGNSLHQLTSSNSGLDSLIGATSALEMADDDPEYLKRYSERVAAEADQSNEAHKDEEMLAAQEAERKKREELAKKEPSLMSVQEARQQARNLNNQLAAGVAEAEARM